MRSQFYSLTGNPDAEISFGRHGARVRSPAAKKSIFGRLAFWISKKTGWYRKCNRATRRAYLAELNERFQPDGNNVRILPAGTAPERRENNAPLLIKDVIETEKTTRHEQSKIELDKRIQKIWKGRTIEHQDNPKIRKARVNPTYKWQNPVNVTMLDPWHRMETNYMNDVKNIAGRELQDIHDTKGLPPSKNEIGELADNIVATSETEAINALLEKIAQESSENQTFHQHLISELARTIAHEITAATNPQQTIKRNAGDFHDILKEISPNRQHEEELAKKILSLTEELLQEPSAKVDEIYARIDAEVEQFLAERTRPLVREFRNIFQASQNSSSDTLGDIFQWVLNQQPAQEDCAVSGIGPACVVLTEEIQRHADADPTDKNTIINERAEKLFKQSGWPSINKAVFMHELASVLPIALKKEATEKLIGELQKENPLAESIGTPPDFNPMLDSVEGEPSIFDQLPNNAQSVPSRNKSFTTELLEAWDPNILPRN